MSVVLQVTHLEKSFRTIRAVNGVSLEVNAGEFVGLIGPNGAGKSTTMNCVCGRIRPDAGEIVIDGHDVWNDPVAARRSIGFVPQHLDLHEYLTGEEYLRFIAEIREVDEATITDDVDALLELTELTDARHRIIKEYSGGMARKIAICGALIGSPKLLVLDESFVGLDPESTFRLRGRLHDHCRAGGAIVLSSHILEMLEKICDRTIMLHDGEVAFDLAMDDAIAQAKTRGLSDLTELYLFEAGKLEANDSSE